MGLTKRIIAEQSCLMRRENLQHKAGPSSISLARLGGSQWSPGDDIIDINAIF
jgi:hypothetical protein